jgi:hypothetical protein
MTLARYYDARCSTAGSAWFVAPLTSMTGRSLDTP